MCWELSGPIYSNTESHYLSIEPAAVVGYDEPFVMRKSQHMNILELLNNQIFGNNDGIQDNLLESKDSKKTKLLWHLFFLLFYFVE